MTIGMEEYDMAVDNEHDDKQLDDFKVAVDALSVEMGIYKDKIVNGEFEPSLSASAELDATFKDLNEPNGVLTEVVVRHTEALKAFRLDETDDTLTDGSDDNGNANNDSVESSH